MSAARDLLDPIRVITHISVQTMIRVDETRVEYLQNEAAPLLPGNLRGIEILWAAISKLDDE